MTTQLRLKIEALQGGQRLKTGSAVGRDRSLALRPPALPRDERVPVAALAELGFSWDAARSLWVRRSGLRLSELGLSAEVMSPANLRSVSPLVGEQVAGPVVCFDLETTGLQRATGTVPFLYGWAVVSGDKVEVEQWFLPDLGQETPLVEAAHQMLKRAGLLVTYNGASFDLPLLRIRAVMTGVERPWPATPHLDLLPLVRRLFRHRLTQCSLRRAEEELLGCPRVGDVPGSEAPERYRTFLRDGDPDPLAPVLEHNRLDLLSLTRLLDHLERHLEVARPQRSDWYSLGRYAEDRGQLQRADALYLGAESESPPPLDRAAALRRTRLLRRQGRDAEARASWLAIWERWRDPEAAEALCVDMEHRTNEPVGALQLAQQALSTAPLGWDRRFAKRSWRLQSRLNSKRLAETAVAQPLPQSEGSGTRRPWASWLPGGTSYEAWLALQRGRGGPTSARAREPILAPRRPRFEELSPRR
ncbi:MAG TPA: ribonuclease H-like domain-containing protein [Candidatus Dormibacteraeota bacterium]|nr:ribonuclease H-like domain-containing protein [Candidatus Dormibacteraeota bacterium]